MSKDTPSKPVEPTEDVDAEDVDAEAVDAEFAALAELSKTICAKAYRILEEERAEREQARSSATPYAADSPRATASSYSTAATQTDPQPQAPFATPRLSVSTVPASTVSTAPSSLTTSGAQETRHDLYALPRRELHNDEEGNSQVDQGVFVSVSPATYVNQGATDSQLKK